jgi:hypothetical protein
MPKPKKWKQAGSPWLSIKVCKNKDLPAHKSQWEKSFDDGGHGDLAVGPIHCEMNEGMAALPKFCHP